jgi:hypothetical protein
MNDLDALLRTADPATSWDDVDIDQRVRVARAASHSSAALLPRKPRWKRARILIPTLGVSMALMGAAVVVPMQLWVDNREVDLDIELPIDYTTASGERVECTYGLYLGSPSGRNAELDVAADRIKEHDWSGIGEAVHRYAVAHPVSPQEGEVWTVDNLEVREKMAFELAVTAVVTDHLSGILPDGAGFAGTTDCTGRLS